MPRERSPARDKAFKIYEEHQGRITNREIANILSEDEKKVAVWKQRDKWSEKMNVVQQRSKSCTNNNKSKKINKEKPVSVNEIIEPYLTDKQRLFAEIYVKNFNATQAARKAGYAFDSAHVTGYDLLRNPKVRGYIEYLRGLKKEAIMAGIDDIVEKQMRIAFSDITDFMEFGQERVPIISSKGPIIYRNPATGKDEILTQLSNTAKLKESWEVDGSIIKEINISRQGTSIKLEDRQKAIDWLTNYFGANPEHKYRQEFDTKKLQLERDRFEHQKKMDESKVW